MVLSLLRRGALCASLTALLFAAQSCQDEQIVTPSEPEVLLATDNPDYHQVPTGTSLADVVVSTEAGMLSFPNTFEFRKAQYAVARAGAEEYGAWIEHLGVATYYGAYGRVLDRLEANPDEAPQAQLTAAELERFRLTEDGLLLPRVGIGEERLLDERGRVLINGDLNIFLEDRHVLVDNGLTVDIGDVTEIIRTDWKRGIIVSPIFGREAQKMQFHDNASPFGGCSPFFPELIDTRRINRTRYKMHNTLEVSAFVTEIDMADQSLQYNSWIAYRFSNWRRNGLWGYRRTWKDVKFTFGAANTFSQVPVLQDFCNILFDNFVSETLLEPGTGSIGRFPTETGRILLNNGQSTLVNQHAARYLADDYSLELKWENTRDFYTGDDRSINSYVRVNDRGYKMRGIWPTFGPQSDPVGAEWFCNQ